MLRNLFTPLRARFDVSPRLPPRNTLSAPNDEPSPEDLARGVMVELMRSAVEQLKQAEGYEEKLEVLAEMQRIMNQNSDTKDVFRELDGFLVLYNVLSTVTDISGDEDRAAKNLEGVRLILGILSDATFEHDVNARFYKRVVGYEPLKHSFENLSSEPKTTVQVLGFLLSFVLHEPGVEPLFKSLQAATVDEVDDILAEYDAHLQTIHHPGALPLLWSLHQRVWTIPSLRFGLSKIFGRLATVCHRNFAVMSNAGLVLPILEHLISSKGDEHISDSERHAWQKLLRRLLELGAAPPHARLILQKVVREDETLDAEMLDLVRYGMRSRWVDHFSMESSSAFVVTDEDSKSLPTTGVTFMVWVFLSQHPVRTPLTLFEASVDEKPFLSFLLRSDGRFELRTTASRQQAVVFAKATIRKSRWTHLALVHYPSRSSNPNIRLFVDAVIQDTVSLAYPKPETKSNGLTYRIGNGTTGDSPSWCFSSAYLVATPLHDDIVRFIHHIGPRYIGNFQDSNLKRFLTYEASTSVNMFLASLKSKNGLQLEESPILKIVRNGMGFNKSQIVFSVSAATIPLAGFIEEAPSSGLLSRFVIKGDVYLAKAACFDSALWTIGGAAVLLRLVQLAMSAHELSRALSILIDGLRNSWQNSEDMERLRGYEILADMLRKKSQYINLTSYELLFEFLGINARSLEQSSIVNLGAYHAIALNFELWSRTRDEIQTVYFEHFTTLFRTSRYRAYNITQRFSKLRLTRRLLFALQTDWFSANNTARLVNALHVACRADFSRDGTIKPVVSYLAANLHEELIPVGSPRSLYSRIDINNARDKAEKVLELLVDMLSDKQFHTKFIAALPLTRICLLLLGNNPSSAVSTQILKLLDISVGFSPSFIRKFELVNGWNIMKTVVPGTWTAEVNDAAFNLLIGRGVGQQSGPTIKCSQIVPTILTALQSGLNTVASTVHISSDEAATQTIQSPLSPLQSGSGPQRSTSSFDQASVIEALVEELLNLHSTVPQFRSIFQSQITTQLFVDGYKSFVKRLSVVSEINSRGLKILEKLTHFGLALALDNVVAGSLKREIMDTMPIAGGILNPDVEKTAIDPSLVADTRTVRQRIASARFSLQVRERTIIKIVMKISEWRKTVQNAEKKRLRKAFLDLREMRRQVSLLQNWTQLLTSQRGLWPTQEKPMYRLDETEGPHRMRIKLEPVTDQIPSFRADVGANDTRDVQAPQVEEQQTTTEVPPWAESYEISSMDMDEPALAEDVVEDKLRRIRHELEPGDVIEAVTTVARISGVDSFPGLLIIGKTHLYMLDGVVEGDDGEIIDAHDAPKELFSVPGVIVELDRSQRAFRWAHSQIAACSEKTFLLRDLALEVYFKDSRSLLLVFLDRKRRTGIAHQLSGIISRNVVQHSSTPGLLRTPGPFSGWLFTDHGSKLFKQDDLATATRKWQAREISNFTYLSILNQISGRTPSDATQYPVFPWVLSDYTSETLDLASPASYRDLGKPMGALTPARREAAKMRYETLESMNEKPFHYGTHFSSSMIVCHFLIRLAPFTNMFKTLQGGDWDLPDRLFADVGRTYESAANDARGDVRELIPEFFTCPEFLENAANLNFGVQQRTGERIHDVKLPPWAKGDPLLFVILHRRALESEYASENLPAWIDLIWGCKQKDPESLNAFHPLSYEGAINLDEITDEVERAATIGIIHNFGQTPRKLFNVPHPARNNHGLSTLPLGTLHGIEEDPHLLAQAPRCFKDLGPMTPVRELLLDPASDKVIPCPQGSLTVPLYPHEQIEWCPETKEIRALVDHKVVQVLENSPCNCARLVDSDCLVTGWADYTVRLWRLRRNTGGSSLNLASGKISISLSHIMRIHTDEVVCVTASRTWSIVVSGSQDGSAVIWDLNRGTYVQSIRHHQDKSEFSSINLVAINESTGYIATCSNLVLQLHTINARPIASLNLTALPSYYSNRVASITSLAFHEREYSHKGILATGASDGSITLWTWEHGNKNESEGGWAFTEVRRMKARPLSGGRPPCVTALKFYDERLYHGEESGKCFVWNFPDSD